MPSAWPTMPALQRALTLAGLISNPPADNDFFVDAEGALTNALDTWERRTGFHPFMASASDSTRKFDSDGLMFLDLNGGLTAVSSVTTNVYQGGTGVILTQDTQYWLGPANAAAAERPYTFLEFRNAPMRGQQSIVVVGKWGFCANQAIPQGAYDAVLRLAILELLPVLQSARSGGATSIKLGADSFTFPASGAFGAEQQAWQTQVDSAVRRYGRTRGG